MSGVSALIYSLSIEEGERVEWERGSMEWSRRGKSERSVKAGVRNGLAVGGERDGGAAGGPTPQNSTCKI